MKYFTSGTVRSKAVVVVVGCVGGEVVVIVNKDGDTERIESGTSGTRERTYVNVAYSSHSQPIDHPLDSIEFSLFILNPRSNRISSYSLPSTSFHPPRSFVRSRKS